MDNSSKIYISCFASNEIIRVDAQTGLVEARATVGKYPFSLIVDKDKLFSTNFWQFTPSYTEKVDNIPNGFYLTDPISVPRNKLTFTNTVIIKGIDLPTPVSVPDIFGVKLYKNGALIPSLKTTAVNDDQFYLEFVTPSIPDKRIEIPLFVGSFCDWFVSVTLPVDSIIDPYYFVDVFDANLNSEYLSNEITITGIDDDVTVIFNTSYGTIVKNGVDSGVASIAVVKNDKIRIRATSDIDYCGKTFAITSCGGYTNVWSIVNVKDIARDSKYVLDKQDQILFDVIGTNANYDLTNYLERVQFGVVDTSINLESAPLGNGISGDVFYVADYIRSRIIKIDLLDGVEQVINVAPDKPYKIAWSDSHVYYTCPDSNKISSLDKQVTFTASRPKDIVFNNYGQMLVSCDNEIAVYKINEQTLTYEYYGSYATPATSLCGLSVTSQLQSQNKSVANFANTQYLSINSNSNFDFGSNDWTFECFIKIDDQQQNQDIILLSNASGSGSQENSNFSFYLKSVGNNKFVLACDLYYSLPNQYYTGTATYNRTGAKLTAIGNVELPKSNWNHIAYTRNSNQLSFYINGKSSQQISVNFSLYRETQGVYIKTVDVNMTYANSNGVLPMVMGTPFSMDFNGIGPRFGNLIDQTSSFYGKISNVRLTNGACLYTKNSPIEFFDLSNTNQTTLFLYDKNSTNSNNLSSKSIVVTSAGDPITFSIENLYDAIYNLCYSTDIQNNKVHEIDGYYHVLDCVNRSADTKELPYSIAMDDSTLYVANFGGSSITTIDLATFFSATTLLPEDFSLPTDIEVKNGKVFITPYREPYLLEYENGEFNSILLAANPIAVNIVNDLVWVTELYGEILDNNNVGTFDHILPLTIPDQLNALFDTYYESQEQTISGQTIRPILVHLEPYSDASIIQNGVDVGKVASFVVGDTFKIRAKSLSFYKKPKTIGLYTCAFQTTFTIITLADLQPDIVVLDAYMDAIPRSRIYSQEFTVTGIDEGEDLPIEILGETDSLNKLIKPTLIVNGVYLTTDKAIVHLGDTIGFSCLVLGTPWNGSRLGTKIRTQAGFEFGFLDIYTAYLDGPVFENRPKEVTKKTQSNQNVTYTQILELNVNDAILYQNLNDQYVFNEFDKKIKETISLYSTSSIANINDNTSIINSTYKTQDISGKFVFSDTNLQYKNSNLQSKTFADVSTFDVIFPKTTSFLNGIYENVNKVSINEYDSSYMSKPYIYKNFTEAIHQDFIPNILSYQLIDSSFSVSENSVRFVDSYRYEPMIGFSSSEFVNLEYMGSSNVSMSMVQPLYTIISGILKSHQIESKYSIDLGLATIENDAQYKHDILTSMINASATYYNKPLIGLLEKYVDYSKSTLTTISFVESDIFKNIFASSSIDSEYVKDILDKSIQISTDVTKSVFHVETKDSAYKIGNVKHAAFKTKEYEYYSPILRMMDYTPIHHANLTKIIAPEVEIHRSLSKFFYVIHAIDSRTLVKFVDSIYEVFSVQSKEIQREAIHSSCLIKLITCAPIKITNNVSRLVEMQSIKFEVTTKTIETLCQLSKNSSKFADNLYELSHNAHKLYDGFSFILHELSHNAHKLYDGFAFIKEETSLIEFDYNQYEIKTNYVIDDESLSIVDRRLYLTAEEAIQAGIDLNYKNVKAYKLQDGSYFWYVPSKVLIKGCRVGDGPALPVAWYMHGG